MSATTANEIAYNTAVSSIRSKIENADTKLVHIFSFNIPVDQLKSAYASLDKQEQRAAMRVTYSEDYNFIVRYLPGAVHLEACRVWDLAFMIPLTLLCKTPESCPPGCSPIGKTVYQADRHKRKQADSGVRMTSSLPPSVVFEVGDSESLGQLRVDARLWLEDFPHWQVQVAVLLTIDRPKIAIELWKALPRLHGSTRPATAAKVWSADWTNTATPMYILLSDIFRGDIPAVYGENLHVDIDTATLRQHIIDSWKYMV